MFEETHSFMKWLATLLSSSAASTPDAPIWLKGAEIEVITDPPDTRLNINGSDGSRVIVFAMLRERSAAIREEQERLRQERLASPEHKEELERVRRDVAVKASELHQEHEGPFSNCNDIGCAKWREWMVRFGADPYITEVDDDIVS